MNFGVFRLELMDLNVRITDPAVSRRSRPRQLSGAAGRLVEGVVSTRGSRAE